MDRKDLASITAALLVILALALIVKPLLLGGTSPLAQYLPVGGRTNEAISTSPPLTNIPAPVATPPPSMTTPSYRTYALLNGSSSGTTESFTMPFNRWILSCSAKPYLNASDNASFIFPRLRIQVVDARDPSRIVRSFEPDLLDARINTSYDPRPWRVEIPEGNRSYFFVVHTQSVESYTLEVLVEG